MRKSEGSSEVPSEMSHVNGNERKMCGYEMMNPISNQVPYHHAEGNGNGNNHGNSIGMSHHHSASGSATDQIISSSNVNANANAECTVREQDRFMPIANVIRIMRKILPPHAKISDDAKETIQECVSEYISFVTGEANERCQREQRKTITAEDLLWAMSKLGFDDYIEPLTLYLHRYREIEGDRGSMLRSCEPFLKLNRPTPMEQYAAFGIGARPVFHLGPPHPPHPGYFRAPVGPPPAASSMSANRYFKAAPEGGDQPSEPLSNGSASSYDPYGQHHD